MTKLGARTVRATIFGMGLAILMTLLFSIGGNVLIQLGVTGVPAPVWSAMGFIFGFIMPLSVEFSKDIDESASK